MCASQFCSALSKETQCRVAEVQSIGQSNTHTHTHTHTHTYCSKDWHGSLLSAVTQQEKNSFTITLLYLYSLYSPRMSPSVSLSLSHTHTHTHTQPEVVLRLTKPPTLTFFASVLVANQQGALRLGRREVKLRASLNTNLSQQHQQAWLGSVYCACV